MEWVYKTYLNNQGGCLPTARSGGHNDSCHLLLDHPLGTGGGHRLGCNTLPGGGSGSGRHRLGTGVACWRRLGVVMPERSCILLAVLLDVVGGV